MLEELKGKEVSIKTARFPAVNLKGKVIDVGDSWIKIQTKKKSLIDSRLHSRIIVINVSYR